MTFVSVLEVAPRDGLQNAPELLATADKISLVARLIATGAKRVEVASFVHPRRVPQMADAEAVIAGLPDDPAVRYTALCLNPRGVDRLIATRAGGRGVDEAGCVLVATDAFGIANQGQSVTEGVEANLAVIAMAREAGVPAQVTIAASFGCPFEGVVPQERVLDLAERMAAAGAIEIAFADTIGIGVPAQVGEMIERARERLGREFPLRVHLHDTRGLATANAWAAYQAGCRTFDSALGGLGGCPFAPGAAGNVATEELTFMFERSGVTTGIDLTRAVEANGWLSGVMGRDLPSRVGRVELAALAKQKENA